MAEYAAEYADLLCQAGAKECTLSVIAQLSNKSASHPNCAFADSASTVMSGVMVSLTPLFKSTVDRTIAFHEYAKFKDVNDMIQKLNAILSIPKGFPQIPAPRKECRSMTFPLDKRNGQYVMCPEQDCECLVYYGDQSRSMIDVLGLGQDPFWDDRVKDFYGWYSKSASKTGQDAWTWEGKDTHKWSTTRGASKRNQSVPANPADRTDPKEKAVPWRDIGDLNTDPSHLYPGKPTDPECPVPKNDYLRKEDQQLYMQWIEQILDLDRRTSKDPRLYCAYCDMNNHPRFTCKHAYRHQKENEKHRCTLCSAFHAPFCCPRAQVNGGSGKSNWARVDYKRAEQPRRNPENLIFDGESMQLQFNLIFQHSVLKVQAKTNSRCVQPQL